MAVEKKEEYLEISLDNREVKSKRSEVAAAKDKGAYVERSFKWARQNSWMVEAGKIVTPSFLSAGRIRIEGSSHKSKKARKALAEQARSKGWRVVGVIEVLDGGSLDKREEDTLEIKDSIEVEAGGGVHVEGRRQVEEGAEENVEEEEFTSGRWKKDCILIE